MRHRISYIFLFLLLLLQTGCKEDAVFSPIGGEGWVTLGGITVSAVATDAAGTRATSTYDAPAASDLCYKFTNVVTGEVREATYSELQGSFPLSTGTHRLEISYGENVMSATPYLYKEVEGIVIKSEETTQLQEVIEVPLVSAIIRPEMAEALAHFTGCTLTLTDIADGTLTGEVTDGTDFFVPAGRGYKLELKGTNLAGIAKELTLKTYDNVTTGTRYIARCGNLSLPILTMPTPLEANAWGSKIYVTPLTADHVTGDVSESDKSAIASQVKYYISADGGTTWQGENDEAQHLFTGLAGGTTYAIKAVFNGIESDVVTTTTETWDGVPNGDFEELKSETLSVTDMAQSGPWYVPGSSSITYQTKESYSIKEPVNWATVNAKTASSGAATQNSWFVVPSAYHTSLTWTSTTPKVTIFVSAKTRTPDIYSSLTAQSGNYAMIIRNVAWDANGTTPSKTQYSSANSSTGYFNTNIPTIANRSAGKLFLGSYSYNNGVESYNEGYTFTVRPSRLSGYYKYSNDASAPDEYGTVTVELLNGNDVIGHGECKLTAQGDYTAFTADIEYMILDKKATSLRIMFASSNYASKNQSDETNKISTTTHLSISEASSYGAILTIDNLTFDY